MQTLDVQDAAQHFSGLVLQVQQGETILLMRSGKAIAQISPVSKTIRNVSHRIGLLHGQGSIPENWKELSRAEIEEEFNDKG